MPLHCLTLPARLRLWRASQSIMLDLSSQAEHTPSHADARTKLWQWTVRWNNTRMNAHAGAHTNKRISGQRRTPLLNSA
eukprot:5463534-Alexandrium_andersonii.AAC.1